MKTSLAQVTVASALLVGVIGGSAAGVYVSTGAPAKQPNDTDVIFEVVHNPPLLVSDGERIRLDFDVVCVGTPCSEAAGELEVVESNGTVHRYTAAGNDATVRFDIDPSVLARGQVTYHGTFKANSNAGSAGEVSWPDAGLASVPMYRFAGDRVVDVGLARFGEVESSGDPVLFAKWGNDVDALGLRGATPDGPDQPLEGPTAFDVDRSENVYILDVVNSRIARASSGAIVQSTPVKIPQDFPDLAVGSDGFFNILFPNGAGTGGAYVDRIDPSGEVVETIDLAAARAFKISTSGSSVDVRTMTGSVPVVRNARSLSVEEQQAASSYSQEKVGRSVVAKHVSDSIVRLAEIRDGQVVGTWEIRSSSWLGPIALVVPVRDGLFLVQSQFSGSESRYLGIALDRSGKVTTTPLPDRRYVDLTAGGEFRVLGDHLYAARTTAEGFEVARYELSELGVG